jgi:hypothetical protein
MGQVGGVKVDGRGCGERRGSRREEEIMGKASKAIKVVNGERSGR